MKPRDKDHLNPESQGASSSSSDAAGEALVAAHAGLTEPSAWRDEGQLAALPLVLSSAPSVWDLCQALRRRWIAALTLGLLSASAGVALVWFLVGEKYTARSLLFVAANRPWIIAPVNENNAFENYQKTQVALAKSRFVLNIALREPRVGELSLVREQPDPVLWLEKNVQADFSVAPEILRISLTGDKPAELAVLVTEVTRAYLDEIVNKEDNERRKKLDSLKQYHIQYEEDLRHKLNNLKKLAELAVAADPQTIHQQHRLQLEHVERARRELLDVEFKIKHLSAEQEVLRAKKKRLGQLGNRPALLTVELDPSLAISLVSSIAPVDRVALLALVRQVEIPDRLTDKYLEQDFVIVQLRKEIAIAEERLGEARKIYDATSPTGAQRLRKEQQALDELYKKVTGAQKDLRPKYEKLQRDERNHELELKIVLLADELAILGARHKDLDQVVQRLDQVSGELKKDAASLGGLQHETEQAKALVKKLAAEIQTLELELKAPPRVRKLEEDGAVVAPMYDAKRRITLASAGGIAAVVLAILGLAWREFRGRRIYEVEQVSSGLGLRVVGALPELPNRARGARLRAGRERYAQNFLTESVDCARAVILHGARTESLQVIMVTSAVSGEGKTSLASHLAASLARAGRRTLLVDADLRKPAMHLLFGQQLEPGLSEVLTGGADFALAIRATGIPGLSILPAGKRNPQVAQSLANEKDVKGVFDRLRQEFDFIIVDTCPVLPVADPLLLGQHVDAALLAVLRDVSRLPGVYAACQRLDSFGIRLLGTVVNGASSSDAYGSPYHYAEEPAKS